MAYAALELHRVGVTIDRVTEACHAVEVRKLTGPGLGILDTYFGVSAALMASARKNSTLGSERGSDNHARGSGTIRQRQRSHAASHDFPNPSVYGARILSRRSVALQNDCERRLPTLDTSSINHISQKRLRSRQGRLQLMVKAGWMLAAQPYTFRGGDGELQPRWGLSGAPSQMGWAPSPIGR